MDDADRANEITEREAATAARRAAAFKSQSDRHLHAASARMERGDAICKRCGGAITIGRLQANPFTGICVKCAERINAP